MQVIKKSINHIKNDIKTYKYNKKHFGKKIARVVFNKSFFYYLLPKKRVELEEKQNKIIYEYLKVKYKYLIDKYNNEDIKYPQMKKKYIWVFWYQGMDSAPKVVKKCFASIKNEKEDYEVVLLTKENIKNYLDIPEKIIAKVENKIITLTHFSDILRMGLLKEYGGIWVDATCFITGDVFKKFDAKTFNSIVDSNSKWCAFFLGGKPNKLFSFCYQLFIDYNLENDSLIEYFLIDHTLRLAYNEVKGCKEIIDEADIKVESLSYMLKKFNLIYEENEYQKIIHKNSINKLTYKKSYKEYIKGKLTNYGYFLSNK